MMRSTWTALTLLLLFVLAVAFRRRWPTLGRRERVLVLGVTGALLLARSLEDAVRWEITSSRLNDVFVWARVAAYLLLAILFTRIRPRALTTLAAAVLLVPLLSASLYLPLELLFDETPRKTTAVGGDVVLEQIPWVRAGNDNRGVDYTVSRRSRRFPLLQRTFRVGRLYRTQCDIDDLSATLVASGAAVVLHCPAGAPGEAPVDEEIPLVRRSAEAEPAVVPSNP